MSPDSLIGMFATAAVVLTAIGVYSLVAYLVVLLRSAAPTRRLTGDRTGDHVTARTLR